ncbi:glycosyltransferase family 4 protein [Roseicella aquatilis]|nr:glycosyltransferase family 4 protein [Roseicella aquatilis]
MRIVLVNSLYYPQETGGAERATRLLAEGLHERGFKVTVVCLSPTGHEVRDEVGGVDIIRLPLANIYWPFGGQNENRGGVSRALWHLVDSYNPVMGTRLGRILDELRPDIVHLNNLAGFSVAAIRAAKRRRLPVLQTLHDYYFACPRTTTFRAGHNCERPCGSCRVYAVPRKRAGRRVDMLCGVSEAMLRRLEQFGAVRDTAARAVVHSANLPMLDSPPRRTDHWPGDRLRVGFLGRLDRTKGLETLLSAMELLRDQPIELAIAGSGPAGYEAELRQRALTLPIDFLGRVEAEHFLKRIDVLVVPSVWHEPFGRVVQEAFACGVPVVGASVGGIPEAIGALGPGFLFPPGSPAHLAEILGRFVAEGLPAAELFDHARRRSHDFSIDHIVQQHVSLYRQLLEDARTKATAGTPWLGPVREQSEGVGLGQRR